MLRDRFQLVDVLQFGRGKAVFGHITLFFLIILKETTTHKDQAVFG